MEIKEMWPLALQALGSHYRLPMEQMIAKLGLPEWCTGILFPALSFEPQAVTAAKLHIRGAYTAEALFTRRLQEAAQLGLVQEAESQAGAYRLTPYGREAAGQIILAAYDCMRQLQPLPDAELEQLARLLYRLVDACLKAPSPPGKWCIQHSRRLDTGESAHVVIRIDQYLSDLSAYRDDAHLAAWQPYPCSGQAWEAFTLVWRGEAATLDEVFGKLERRGFSREEYRQALADLVQQGWLEADNERYSFTPLGGQIRQQAEALTDEYFYAPWRQLGEADLQALPGLLLRLRENLT